METERQVGRDGGRDHYQIPRACQKEILREKHGIDWKTPAEMKAGVILDWRLGAAGRRPDARPDRVL